MNGKELEETKPYISEQTPLKGGSPTQPAVELGSDGLDEPSMGSIPSERGENEITKPAIDPVEPKPTDFAAGANPTIKPEVNAASNNQVLSLQDAAVNINPTTEPQQPRDDENPQVLMTLPAEPPNPADDSDNPAPPPESPRRNYKDAMTYGERFLYYKCLRRIDAYDQIIKPENPRDHLLAMFEWSADTTYMLSKDDASLQINFVASTAAKIIVESQNIAFPGEIPTEMAVIQVMHLHQKLNEKIAEFRSRDPDTYVPTESWFKRAWPEVDCSWTGDLEMQTEIPPFFYFRFLDSSLARRINMEWILLQLILWIVITLIREAAADKKGSPTPISGGAHIVAVIIPVLVLLVVVRCLAPTKYLWKYVIRGAWLAYSVWFSFATTMDDLRYLVAPLVLCLLMYGLSWKKVVLRIWVTYAIGVFFMLVTFIVYLATKAPITWKNFLLMFYLYNTWIAIHLDVVVSKLLRRILSDRIDLGKYEFMSWFTFATGFVFHFLTIIIITVLAILALMSLICIALFMRVSEALAKAKEEQKVYYEDDIFGFNRRAAERELEERVARARAIRRNAPAVLACLMVLIAIMTTCMAFIMLTILLPFPCLLRPRTVDPIQYRYQELSKEDTELLQQTKVALGLVLAREQAFREQQHQ